MRAGADAVDRRSSYREVVARDHRFPHPVVVDLLVAAVAVAFPAVVATQIEPAGGERAVDGFGFALIAVAGGALAFRRRWPLAVVGAVTAALTVYLGRDYAGGPVFLTEIVALYSLATAWERRAAFAVALVASGWLIGVGFVLGTGPGLIHLVFAGWAAAAVFLGDAVRSRRAHLSALEERAHQLEVSREQEAARRVAEERVRIARDLHDSVAHAMTAINVQAGAAAHVIDRNPDRARDALVVIQQQSRDVLAELAALLGVLRDPTEAPARAPTPGLDDLESLVDGVRRAGLDVRLEHRRGLTVPAAVGVAAYRIVQESLTNVVRHAGAGSSTVVTVTGNGHGALTVEIADDGRGAGPAGAAAPRGHAGVGLTGMRERAVSTGGSLEAGPRPEGGFLVRACWPGRP